jgi:hypothetical protein
VLLCNLPELRIILSPRGDGLLLDNGQLFLDRLILSSQNLVLLVQLLKLLRDGVTLFVSHFNVITCNNQSNLTFLFLIISYILKSFRSAYYSIPVPPLVINIKSELGFDVVLLQ